MTTTLLITTFNRGGLLQNSLERLTQLALPDEVLVVDDGGADNTEEVCASFNDRLPIRYVYHNNPGQTICSFARNVGVKLATGDQIVTSEPELIWETDVLAQFLTLRETHPSQVISAGHVTFLDGSGERYGEAVGWVAPHAAIYQKDWLFEAGGWDEEFPGPWGWDDTDLLSRLRLLGYGQVIATDVRAKHQWHGLGADLNGANEAHFLSKSFHENHDTNPDLTDVVANRDKEWGVLRPPD